MIKYPLNVAKGGEKMLKRFRGEYKSYLIAFVAIATLVGIMWIFSVPCPIKYITGMSCAGCGMSRAIFSAFSLDFSAAFAYHPLWIVIIPAAAAIVILSAKKKTKTVGVTFCCLVVLFIAVWILRLILKDSVVAFEPENSMINSLIEKLSGK